MKKFLTTTLLATLAFSFTAAAETSETPAAPAKEAEKTTEKKAEKKDKVTRELLSFHDAIATYEGSKINKCRHMTALCPDKCGHTKTVATFKVVKYNKYEKKGEYGDPKADMFITAIEDMPKEFVDKLEKMKKGDVVRIVWKHEYVKDNGNMYPERTLQELTPGKIVEDK